MAKIADILNGIFKRTDIKISVLISCCLVVIMLLSSRFLFGFNRQVITDAMYEKGKMVSILGAKSIGMTLETAIDSALLTQEAVFDSQYERVAATEPQLFHTKYDTYFDDVISQLQPDFFKDKNIVYARPMDINGYVPLKGGANIADRKSVENVEDPLAKQILAGKRISRIVASTVSGFVQDYTLEGDEHIWEFSTPIYVKGKRWGSFSVGYRNLEAGSGAGSSIKTFVLVVISILLACGVVFGVVLYFLKPIPNLGRIAEQVADGNIDLSVGIGGSDDIATLADAIERLRVSLKLSMDRLASK